MMKFPPPREIVGVMTKQAFQAVKDSKGKFKPWMTLLIVPLIVLLFVAILAAIGWMNNLSVKKDADFIVTAEGKTLGIPCNAVDLPFEIPSLPGSTTQESKAVTLLSPINGSADCS